MLCVGVYIYIVIVLVVVVGMGANRGGDGGDMSPPLFRVGGTQYHLSPPLFCKYYIIFFLVILTKHKGLSSLAIITLFVLCYF